MRKLAFCVLMAMVTCGGAFAQSGAQFQRTLNVNGHSGQATVIQQNGQVYVDVAALANIAQGSLSFSGNQIVLTLPAGGPASDAAPSNPASDTALSREFMKAAVEEIGLLREWASPMGYNIQNGYPIDEGWVTRNQDRASTGLRMASVAASTNGDRNALELLTNEFNGVRDWSNQLIDAQKSMDTAKYTMSQGALRNEPQSQKLITCWRFLSSMLVSGSFQDYTSCH